MKKTRILAVLGAVLFATLATAAVETLVIKIQSSQLRNNPQFFAPTVLALKAGDKLEKLSEASGWVQVKTEAGLVGWVHSSALTTLKLYLRAAGKDLKDQATASEVTLAAKGFNKKVEDSYKTEHKEANFAAVDAMLAVKVTRAQIEEFIKKGRLGEYQGGGR